MSRFFVWLLALLWAQCGDAAILRSVSEKASKEVLELTATTFELQITDLAFVAILFYEGGSRNGLVEEWASAATLLGGYDGDITEVMGAEAMDGEMAQIDASAPGMAELLDAYQIAVPSIKIFRGGLMQDWDGPHDAGGMAAHWLLATQPSVTICESLLELQAFLASGVTGAEAEAEAGKQEGEGDEYQRRTTGPTIVGVFDGGDGAGDDDDEESVFGTWQQFSAAADTLRGHSTFLAVKDGAVAAEMGLGPKATQLPVFFMVDGGGAQVQYTGEMLEANLVEWVLRRSSPKLGELSMASSAAEIFRTQFFGSRKRKFILILPGPEPMSQDVAEWAHVADQFADNAVFAFMVEEISEVLTYFDVVHADFPVLVAQNPLLDQRFVSDAHIALDADVLGSFVKGVLDGSIAPVLKSQDVAALPHKTYHAVNAVGGTVEAEVGTPGVDVLLAVYQSGGTGGYGGSNNACSHCGLLLPAVEVLAKATQTEPRIKVVKVDASLNDLPVSMGVSADAGGAKLLWFTARDKETAAAEGLPLPPPRDYWDAGTSLQELLGFVVRHSSFEAQSLQVATQEQLSMLLEDEDVLREDMHAEDRLLGRNEGRPVYDDAWSDYLYGDVIFDGTRWHVLMFAVMVAVTVGLLASSVYSAMQLGAARAKKNS